MLYNECYVVWLSNDISGRFWLVYISQSLLAILVVWFYYKAIITDVTDPIEHGPSGAGQVIWQRRQRTMYDNAIRLAPSRGRNAATVSLASCMT